MIDIVIVGYRKNKQIEKLEDDCIRSVKNLTSCTHKLVYIDNYKAKMTLTQAWNKMIQASSSEYICLLNNDTVVFPNWLNNMFNTLTSVPNCGFVGPSTNCCHGPQSEIKTYEEAVAISEPKYVKMMQPLSGFCLLFHKKIWNRLGGFDEKYQLYGQESDFLDRAKKRLNMDGYWQRNSFVFHYGETSVKASGIDVNEARNRAKKLYWRDRGKKT